MSLQMGGAASRSLVAVVLAATLLGSVACSEGDADAIAVVDEPYASFNAGEVETWVKVLERGSSYDSEERETWAHDFVTDVMTEQIDGGASYESVACVSQGRGSWEVAAVELNPVAGYLITCDTTYVNAAGSEFEESFEWVVDDGPSSPFAATPPPSSLPTDPLPCGR